MECGGRTIEATPEAEEGWVAHVNVVGHKTLYPRANFWYMDANIPGKPRIFMPYIVGVYRQACDEIAADGYRGLQSSDPADRRFDDSDLRRLYAIRFQ
jgi:cyclohexanone monooxygenase